MALSPRDKLGMAIIRVCGIGSSNPTPQQQGAAPYFGTLLRGLVRKEIPGLPTMAVTNNGILLWGPEFVAKQPQEVLVFALIHECLHLALRHHDRAVAAGVDPKPTADDGDAALANWAQDACNNEQIEKSGIKVPSWALMPEHPAPMWFGAPAQPRGLIWEQRYRLLKEHRPQSRKQRAQQQGQGDGDGDGEPGQGTPGPGKPSTGGGWCGSCAAHPMPQEPPGAKPDADGRSPAEMERMRKATAEAVKEFAAKARGTVPEDLQRWADEFLAPPVIPWREKLARLIRGAVAYKSGAVDYTFTRISRRQAGVGFGVGRPVVPALHAPIPHVACALDVSGSMGPADLSAALSEVQGVLSAVAAQVTFVVCDAAVHGIKPIKSIGEAAKMMKGGGGTLMEPAIKAIAELKRDKPSIAIVLTDGYCDDAPNYGLKLLWVIVGGNKQFKPTHGDVVFVEEDAAA